MLAARTVLLLMLLLTFSLHRATAHVTPIECCFQYAQKPVRHVQSFYEMPSDCSLPAVVVVTATGAEICADPKKPWVKRAMKNLQRKKWKPLSAIHSPTHASSPPVSGGSR